MAQLNVAYTRAVFSYCELVLQAGTCAYRYHITYFTSSDFIVSVSMRRRRLDKNGFLYSRTCGNCGTDSATFKFAPFYL
jgi:hypothetical protein